MADFKKGDGVRFRAGRATVDTVGKVAVEATTTGEGRSKRTWVEVDTDDGRRVKASPASLRAA